MTGRSWNSYPMYSSQEFLEKLLRANSNVKRVTKHSPNSYTVERRHGAALELYMTPVYILGVADYSEMRLRFPSVNAIVLASNWNSASQDVYEKGIEDGVGIYDMSGLMGALNIEDDKRRVRYGAPQRDITRLGVPRSPWA